MSDLFDTWFEALEKRHTSELTFPEIRRAVQALSATYVERRERIGERSTWSGRGKRAAFALYYAPLHFLLVREIVRGLGAGQRTLPAVTDLGCGTGAAGAAWASLLSGRTRLTGIDRQPWALEECRWNYRVLQLKGTTRAEDLSRARWNSGNAIIAAYTINELESGIRSQMLRQFLGTAAAGAPVLVIEPIARRMNAWWDEWAAAFASAGGRSDEWRFAVPLPDWILRMDRAAGLDHSELSGRSLWLAGKPC